MRTQSRAPLHITCARYGTAPNLGERPCSGKQRRCPLRPKVRPDERPCNNQNASQRQMAVPTDEEDRRREPMTGANAKSRLGYGGEKPLCISDHKRSVHPPETMLATIYNEKERSARMSHERTCPTALTAKGSDPRPDVRQVLGCLARGPTGGRPAGSQLAAVVSAKRRCRRADEQMREGNGDK